MCFLSGATHCVTTSLEGNKSGRKTEQLKPVSLDTCITLSAGTLPHCATAPRVIPRPRASAAIEGTTSLTASIPVLAIKSPKPYKLNFLYSLTNVTSTETNGDCDNGYLYSSCMKLHERILKARRDADLTQEALATLVGKTRGAVSQWESGEVRPRHGSIVAIAKATNTDPTWLESGIDEENFGLSVVGVVAAGTWQEGSVEYEPSTKPVAPHPHYPPHAQRLYQVSGNSLNRLVNNGEYIHAVNVMDAALIPQHGDLVVVRRLEHGLSEYTAKRLLIIDGERILRPESNDPQWQTDVVLNGNEDTEITITDIVIAKWSPIGRL